MFEIQNRIIIVDDTQGHLDRLAQEFLSCGLGCRPLLFDNLYNEPLKNVRIAFFDINLYSQGIDLNQQHFDYTNDAGLASIFNGLANAIELYISRENGPFALIFWTSNSILIENFIQYVRDRQIDLPKPVLVNCIDKDQFINGGEIDAGGMTIQDKISEILGNSTTKLVFEFEKKAEMAASAVINQIYDLIPSTDAWGDNSSFNRNLELVFSKMACQALGHTFARQFPNRAIYEALAPTVQYELMKMGANGGWDSFLSTLRGQTVSYPQNFSAARLNSIFHVDENSEADHNTRGAVFEYMLYPPVVRRLDYWHLLDSRIKKHMQRFLGFVESASESSKEQIYARSRFLLIEISSACDYSQDKPRNNKYVSAVMVPKNLVPFVETKYVGEAVFFKDFPVFHYGEVDWQMYINFNYIVSDFTRRKFGNLLFVLKKEIMDMIGNRYANYSSRIGITSF